MLDTFTPISYSGFLAKAAADMSINFIAFVITPWHALSLDASIKYLQSKGIKLKGMVLVYPHDLTGVNVSHESFLNDCYSIYLEDNSITCPNSETNSEHVKTKTNVIKAFINRRKSHFAFYKYILFCGRNVRHLPEMYLMQTVHPEPTIGIKMMSRGRFMRYVCFDEGVGTYIPDDSVQLSLKGIKQYANYFRKVIVGKMWIKYLHQVTYTMLLEKKGGLLFPRKNVIPFYQQVIKEHVATSKIQLNLSESVVIAPSVYDEIKQYYNGEEMRVWSEVCELLHKRGYRIYMKPHPRDNFF